MGEGIAMGGKQGRKKRNWLPLQLAAAMPLATLALAALAARLILGGKLPESSLPVAAGVIAEDELPAAKNVLSAAALTYLASLLTSFVYFLRFLLYVLSVFGKRDRQ